MTTRSRFHNLRRILLQTFADQPIHMLECKPFKSQTVKKIIISVIIFFFIRQNLDQNVEKKNVSFLFDN